MGTDVKEKAALLNSYFVAIFSKEKAFNLEKVG
jgi:hypothetical protein